MTATCGGASRRMFVAAFVYSGIALLKRCVLVSGVHMRRPRP